MLLQDWIYILIELIIILFFNIFFISLCFVIFFDKRKDKEKNSNYECGFDPYEDARGKFEIRFFLVSILFIIFDVEILFLLFFPLLFIQYIFVYFFFNIIFFLLLMSLLYEWIKGGMDW